MNDKIKGLSGVTFAIVMFVGVVTFVGIAIVTNLFSSDDLPVRISGALLEAVITALMTYFLLTGQTSQEEKKEKNGKIFEKKQEVYHNFLKKLQEIIQDGEIKTDVQSADGKIDELKDLIFQLGYLQMHTSEETINGVLDQLVKMIQCMNDYNSTEEKDKQKSSPDFYSSLSVALFQIVSILKKDLYKKDSKPIEKKKMVDILRKCGLFVETTDFDEYDLQQYFWEELRKQLKNKKYPIEDPEKDFALDIKNYYAHNNVRYRKYGLTFEVYRLKGAPVCFRIEIDRDFYYGFLPAKEKEENKEITECLKKIGFDSNAAWLGYKRPSRKYCLRFWEPKPEDFDKLKDPDKRERFIEGLVKEIEMYLEEFKKIAKEKKL